MAGLIISHDYNTRRLADKYIPRKLKRAIAQLTPPARYVIMPLFLHIIREEMTTKDKGTVLITGAAKRIGAAITLALAKDGYSIALHYHRSFKEAKEIYKTIKQTNGNCELFSCDLADERRVSKLIGQVKKTFPNLSVLINNASIFQKSTIKSPSLASFNNHMAINFKTPYILTKEFANNCKKGAIINILDTNIVKKRSAHADYLLSKKALMDLTLQSALELAPHISVNAIAPGLILPAKGSSNAYLNRRAKNIPMKKRGGVHDVVESVRFILNSTFMTGQIIFNDGGEHLL